jgi:transposase-like protein
MTGKDSELKVVRQSRDGRRRYDEGGKRVLIEAALRPGASVARLAQEHGINANLLRKWIAKYLMVREKGIAFASQETRADERDLPNLPSTQLPTKTSVVAWMTDRPTLRAHVSPSCAHRLLLHLCRSFQHHRCRRCHSC